MQVRERWCAEKKRDMVTTPQQYVLPPVVSNGQQKKSSQPVANIFNAGVIPQASLQQEGKRRCRYAGRMSPFMPLVGMVKCKVLHAAASGSVAGSGRYGR